MTLRDDIEQWRRNVVTLQEGMEEIRYLSNRISECPIDELRFLLSQVSELCQESLTQVEYLRENLADIQSRWGSGTILGSIIFPTISLANTSADSAMISSIITDLSKNPFAYKAIPWLKMLGDSGELVLWKILLDPEGKEKLDLSEVEIKPKLEYDPAKKPAEPDFYIPSRKLICDAKAWKPADIDKGKKSSVEINPQSLKCAASKYARCLKDGGEVRLYFPEDTYHQQKERLDMLSSEVQSQFSNVKINMLPMPGVTHKDLNRQTQFRVTFLKWLAASKN
ncbi:hypothetical protein [Planktothricoides raciborskii]|uniref:Uncharacterized protein n=1 Tax=Planktothricoides raciborskii FACHB-1370 TaxID=2949576 RepID=A0ABR8ELQ5_9CYAN|nr:hypothetical protein [Planktothricoides raciborskii]MBD2546825.1 hypothetical protein [Planktothricoides raciborskii FACHB-1370]MBD2585297.1 hypothetical protein [Planktothricoides raciborskii FACHB-1261]